MLSPADFDEFVHDVHGWSPFPWQRALVGRIVAERAWPETIDVPTGLGKTSLLDVAVFLAAATPALSRRRVFFVVDRRLVVDEAYRHALRIQHALDHPRKGGVAEQVAGALRQRGDHDATVLEVTRMRGGVTWDARWVDRPDRYAIVTGTVDQVGSRLLFRGYGVTEEARSLDAALVGTDSLIIVDEAHLSQPLLGTVRRIPDLDPLQVGSPQLPRPRVDRGDLADRSPRVVTMSATAPRAGASHGITSADEAHPVAGPRLRAAKRIRLVEVRTSRAAAATTVPEALAMLALALTGPGHVVGVVANTVARARAVFDQVHDKIPQAVLLTGRIRPVDRDYLLAKHYDRLRAGRERDPAAPPLVLVATQTVEVGANIDFDVLVTESAPLDALVQRLGRLNRFGHHTHPAAPALVVHDSSVDQEDPVYGSARLATWDWLSGRSGTDVVRYTRGLDLATLPDGLPASPLELRELLRDPPPELLPHRPPPPVLTESVLDAWARTSPGPHPDPPVAPYLHGIVESPSAVRVIWRAGLLDVGPERWPDALERMPLAAEEGVEVPLAAARRWLEAGAADPLLNDQDSDAAEPIDSDGRPTAKLTRVPDEEGRPQVLKVRGRADAWPVPSTELAPGDLFVAPAEYGGHDEFGWEPSFVDPVVDVADLATRRGRPRVRIGPYLQTVVERYHRPELAKSPALAELLAAAAADADREVVQEADYGALLGKLADALAPDDPRPGPADPPPLPANLRVLRGARMRASLVPPVTPGPEPSAAAARWHIVLVARGAAQADDRSAAGSSVVGEPTLLDRHQEAVARRAAEFAGNLGLAEPLRVCVRLAGRWHDEGKRDPRFQAMLWGGDRRRAEIAVDLLAKSGMDPDDRAAFRRAWIQARYPDRMRHEALSARIAALLPAVASCPDPELVVHLVTAHHGHGRPLLPPVVDLAPEQITVAGQVLSTEDTVDWDGPARFARLNQRYGRWGLALLETVVRLADIWCSARGEEAQP